MSKKTLYEEPEILENYSTMDILWLALKRHKKGIFLVILLAMMSSTLAWIYSRSEAGVELTVEMESWNVSIGDQPEYEFNFDKLYPGVSYPEDDLINAVKVSNNGDGAGEIQLQVESIYLFGEEVPADKYVIDQQDIFEGTEKVGTLHVINGFPFEFQIKVPQNIINPHESTIVHFMLEWPYESDPATCLTKVKDQTILDYVNNQKELYENIGITVHESIPTGSEVENINITTCDILDTYYGEKEYAFKQEKEELGVLETDRYYKRPTDPEGFKRPTKAVHVKLLLKVAQVENSNNPVTTEPTTTP